MNSAKYKCLCLVCLLVQLLLKLNATALSEVRELIKQNCPKKVEIYHCDRQSQFEVIEEAGSDVDDELMAMKAQLTGSSTNQTTTNSNNPATSSSTPPSNSAVDKDLEELKRQMNEL